MVNSKSDGQVSLSSPRPDKEALGTSGLDYCLNIPIEVVHAGAWREIPARKALAANIELDDTKALGEAVHPPRDGMPYEVHIE